ncbi:MAG: hypothetical protein AAGF24_15025, partial [Cyanobacteria bacterium P01_H01_bin.121]
MLTIQAVTTAANRDRFLDLPAQIYQSDPNWVPPLRSSIAKQLDAQDPHTRSFCEFELFLALQDGRSVGRVVAAINQRLIEREQQAIGLIGYFECIKDAAITKALLETACQWLRDRGMTQARGPINLSTHNSCFFLVDGFGRQPVFMTPHNPDYYPTYWEAAGWTKAKDAYAYDFPLDQKLIQQFERSYAIARKSGITFRPLHTKGKAFEQDCRQIYELFSTAFAASWSSTPRTWEEFFAEAQDLKAVVDPDIFPMAEDNGKLVGFFMALPDYNIPFKYVNGKLDWLGMLKLLWYRRQINQARVITIASLPEYRRKMVSPALIYLGMQGGLKPGKPYQWAELSWVWEDNAPSRKLIEAAGGTIYRTYR